MNNRFNSGVTPAVRAIIGANIVLFIITYLSGRIGLPNLTSYLGLYLPQSEHWRLYQYLTHMFMHGGIMHIFFNMFAVYMFGRILENVWGTERFIVFYLITGLGAALLNSAIGWFHINSMETALTSFQAAPSPGALGDFIKDNISHPAPWLYEFLDNWTNNPNSPDAIRNGVAIFQQIINESMNVPMVGASGAVFGLLVAFGMLFPNTELYMFFIPIPIKAKYMVIGYGLIELYSGIQNNPSDNIAHFAHLGGLIVGFILVKIWSRNRAKFY